MKKILFINKQAPYGSSTAQEGLDVLLMASTFAQDISVLFLGDAVWQLKKDQNPDDIKAKNFSVTYKALPLYDIEKVYVDQQALEQRNLALEDLLISVELLTTEQISELMSQQDHIVSF
jgi:tRNA 2-thiouridine synthesizing protein C